MLKTDSTSHSVADEVKVIALKIRGMVPVYQYNTASRIGHSRNYDRGDRIINSQFYLFNIF